MSSAIRLENAANEFRKIQQDLSNVIEGRQRLDSQLRENEIVQKEFQLLKEDSNIFKLIGPVLVKQDKAEAVQNVNKRLEYIRSEMFNFTHFGASDKDFYGVVLLQQEDMMLDNAGPDKEVTANLLSYNIRYKG
nr:4351_t:CDS:2 [Entrophospora candida]